MEEIASYLSDIFWVLLFIGVGIWAMVGITLGRRR